MKVVVAPVAAVAAVPRAAADAATVAFERGGQWLSTIL